MTQIHCLFYGFRGYWRKLIATFIALKWEKNYLHGKDLFGKMQIINDLLKNASNQDYYI